jgi:hypothetical protein
MTDPKANRPPKPILDIPKDTAVNNVLTRNAGPLQDKIRTRAHQLYESKTRRTGCEPRRKSSSGGNQTLNCRQCRDLDRALRLTLAKYVEACAAALYRVTKEFAAKSQVDMERSRNDMEDHLLVCGSIARRFVEVRPEE